MQCYVCMQVIITIHIWSMMQRLCFQSFCPSVHGVGGGGGPGICTIWLMSQGLSTFWLKSANAQRGGSRHMHYLANVPGIGHFLAKKCSCPEGGGVISQNAMQVAYISIMHCSLPVISLLTCCQKEVLEACICLYSQVARHYGILLTPPPPPPKWALIGSFQIRHRNYAGAWWAIDIRIASLSFMCSNNYLHAYTHLCIYVFF